MIFPRAAHLCIAAMLCGALLPAAAAADLFTWDGRSLQPVPAADALSLEPQEWQVWLYPRNAVPGHSSHWGVIAAKSKTGVLSQLDAEQRFERRYCRFTGQPENCESEQTYANPLGPIAILPGSRTTSRRKIGNYLDLTQSEEQLGVAMEQVLSQGAARPASDDELAQKVRKTHFASLSLRRKQSDELETAGVTLSASGPSYAAATSPSAPSAPASPATASAPRQAATPSPRPASSAGSAPASENQVASVSPLPAPRRSAAAPDPPSHPIPDPYSHRAPVPSAAPPPASTPGRATTPADPPPATQARLPTPAPIHLDDDPPAADHASDPPAAPRRTRARPKFEATGSPLWEEVPLEASGEVTYGHLESVPTTTPGGEEISYVNDSSRRLVSRLCTPISETNHAIACQDAELSPGEKYPVASRRNGQLLYRGEAHFYVAPE